MNSTGGGFNVTASGASVDGFVIRDASAPGVSLSSGASGYSLLNNIIRDNTFGVYLNSDGASQTVLRRHRRYRCGNPEFADRHKLRHRRRR